MKLQGFRDAVHKKRSAYFAYRCGRDPKVLAFIRAAFVKRDTDLLEKARREFGRILSDESFDRRNGRVKKLRSRPELFKLIWWILHNYDETEPLCGEPNAIRTNNAATGVPTVACLRAVFSAYLQYSPYAGRHSGDEVIAARSAPDTRAATYAYHVNNARAQIESFVGIDEEKDAVIYTSNTSNAAGLLALMCGFGSEDVVLVPQMEHTSNRLPWMLKSGALFVSVKQKEDGSIDLEDLKGKLEEFRGRVRIVAFTAASNITGVKPQIREVVELAHSHGAMAAVDCAQYAPHFPMNKKAWGADFVYFSGHKLGAPTGPGVLAAPKKWLEEKTPAIPGGGTVKDIAKREDGGVAIEWSREEAKHQPGTWPTMGIIELAAATAMMEDIGWRELMERERALLAYAFKKFSEIPGFKPLLADAERYEKEQLTPVISFNLEGFTPDELSSRLAGKGVQHRGGSQDPICNHEYVRDVLRLSGIVRLSFNYHNTREEIDRIAEILWQMRKERPLAI